MNTTLTTRIARIVSAAAGAVLITFAGVSLIADYALPAPSASGHTQLASNTAPPIR